MCARGVFYSLLAVGGAMQAENHFVLLAAETIKGLRTNIHNPFDVAW
jgi:hypothetical protein